MKRIIALLLCCSLLLSGCMAQQKDENSSKDNLVDEQVSFESMSDPQLIP